MLFSLILTGILLAAAAIDLKTFRIPNVLPLAVMVIFLMKSAAAADVWSWPQHVSAFGLMFGLGFVLFAMGLIGGGDAKLMAALALWLGMPALPSFLVMTALCGGTLAVILLALRYLVDRTSRLALPDGSVRYLRLLERTAPVPYAPAIAFAALWLEWSP